MNAFDLVCRLDREGKLETAPQKQKQKIATVLLCRELYTQVLAGPISARASRILGPISRHRITDILPHMKRVSCASRPGLTAFYAFSLMDDVQFRDIIVKNRKIRAALDAQMDLTLSLSHHNMSALWGQSDLRPLRNHLLHDLITQIFLRSLQYGVTVMGIIDAFVYAHHQHRLNLENPGNFGDCTEGRIRFMTAITPGCAHAYRVTCLTRHRLAIVQHNFR